MRAELCLIFYTVKQILTENCFFYMQKIVNVKGTVSPDWAGLQIVSLGSATWYTTHVSSTVLTAVLSDPLLL
jgi:hypothetical protein